MILVGTLVLCRLFDVCLFIQPAIIFQLLIAALNNRLNIFDEFIPERGTLHNIIGMAVYKYLSNIKRTDVQLLMQQPEFYTDNIQGLLREGRLLAKQDVGRFQDVNIL